MMAKSRKRRIPKLAYTDQRGLGYYASYRDPETGTPRKKRFGQVSEQEARVAYHRWLSCHLDGVTEGPTERRKPRPKPPAPESTAPTTELTPGCLLEVASGLLRYEESRTRNATAPRSKGTISRQVFEERSHYLKCFLQHLTGRHGSGSLSRITLVDLAMRDVESYNQTIVAEGYSANVVSKRMQVVKSLIDRAGRPEFGQQVLCWNWDSRDVLHGKPAQTRVLPTRCQLERMLSLSAVREQTLIWMGIGLGFGQGDLSKIRVGQIDEQGYDLRRGKTGIDRYGETPPLVWQLVQDYLTKHPRSTGELLFVTRKGMPLVHEGRSDAVQTWWGKLRRDVGETNQTLSGFYTLRHLGATEFGSRPGCSLSAMRRWLGHSASSSIADVYMRPVAPEQREVVEWVRNALKANNPLGPKPKE